MSLPLCELPHLQVPTEPSMRLDTLDITPRFSGSLFHYLRYVTSLKFYSLFVTICTFIRLEGYLR